MIVHSLECRERWRAEVGRPWGAETPSADAWHFTCTNGCEARHGGALVITGEARATVTKADETLRRAFGGLPEDE